MRKAARTVKPNARTGERHTWKDRERRRKEERQRMAAEALIVEDAYQRGYADAIADMRKKKEQRRQREQAKRDELKRLKNEVDRRRKAMQELYLDKVSGLIDTVQFAAMNEAFLQEVKQSETRIQTLESELKATKEDNDTVPAQMEKVRKLAQVPYLTRELVVLLIDRVVVEPKESLSGTQKVTIEWNF